MRTALAQPLPYRISRHGASTTLRPHNVMNLLQQVRGIWDTPVQMHVSSAIFGVHMNLDFTICFRVEGHTHKCTISFFVEGREWRLGTRTGIY